MRTIMVTGVCGVGKSIIVRSVAKSLAWDSGDYADFMLDVMRESNKDRIEHLTWERKRWVYTQVAAMIKRKFSYVEGDTEFFMLENHLTVVQNESIVSFPVEGYSDYNMAGLVVIEATPFEVVQRRMRDPVRRRGGHDPTLIERQQQQNWDEAQKISQTLGVPCTRFLNPDGSPPINDLLLWVRELVQSKVST